MDRNNGLAIIELIFIMIILGILAAVAFLKFIVVGNQAHEVKVKSFVESFNKSVGPALWSKSLSIDKNGDISGLAIIENATFLKTYTDIPKEIDQASIDLTKCNDTILEKVVATCDKNIVDENCAVTCKDGNVNQLPVFHVYRTGNTKANAGDSIKSSWEKIY